MGPDRCSQRTGAGEEKEEAHLWGAAWKRGAATAVEKHAALLRPPSLWTKASSGQGKGRKYCWPGCGERLTAGDRGGEEEKEKLSNLGRNHHGLKLLEIYLWSGIWSLKMLNSDCQNHRLTWDWVRITENPALTPSPSRLTSVVVVHARANAEDVAVTLKNPPQ